MRIVLKILSFIALALTVVPSFLVFAGTVTLEQHKTYMLLGTLMWFATGPMWMNKKD